MLTTRFLAFILACLLTTLTLHADPITREQALQKASRYLMGQPGSRKLIPVTNTRKLAPRRQAPSTTEAYYAFNRGEQEGFVLVAADDRIEPVLGYTEQGEFDYAAIPDNMRYWLDTQEEYIRYLQANPTVVPTAVPTHAAVSPMLTSQWNQSSPYWDECPTINGQRTVTGCVATAMAQVLYFQRSKSVDEIQAAIPSYTTRGHGISVEGVAAGSPIDWNNMIDTYGNNATGLQKKAVAQLMRYCGVAVEMDYGLAADGGSGAYSYMVAEGMNKYFGYGNAKYVKQWEYSEEGWDAMLYNELANGRVFYLSGSNAKSGHAFVCHGYDGNRCYRINWGWGGLSDGWFLLTALTPGQQGPGGSEDGSGFSDSQEAVIGCEPIDYKNKAITFANVAVKTICVNNWDTNEDGNLSYGEAAAVTDLGTAFQGQTISSFNELYYFTGLTAINEDAFNGCTLLSTIKLPKKLTAIKARAFKGCTALKTLALPENLKEIGDNAFEGCKTLAVPEFPDGLLRIGSQAFSNCVAFKDIVLPSSLQELGEGAFNGCTKLATFTVKNPAPQGMAVGTSLFADIDLSAATLYIPQGTRSYFAQSETWNGFGTIKEMRDHTRGSFAELETSKDFYLYNVGTGRFLTMGEAWGCQAIVGKEPMRFQFRLTGGNYYLYSKDTGKNNKILYRTWDDNQVGKNIAACFVDGTLSADAYWTVTNLGGNVYTLQIPSNQAKYQEDQFFGIDPNHESNMASPTYGAYSDIPYSELPYNCQWRLVPYDEAAETLYLESERLGAMLTTANKKKLYVDAEQAVYDNMNSTLEQIREAQYMLRRKLNLINFADPAFRTIAIVNWDINSDHELSYDEAARVTDVGVTFQKNTSITSLEDLQYFTGLTTIAANNFQQCTKVTAVTLPSTVATIDNYAFNSCSKITSIVLPENVRKIGTGAFTGCSSLTAFTVSAANPADIRLVGTVFTANSIKNATLYVPLGTKELYAAADTWKDFGEIKETRTHVKAGYSPVEVNVQGYIYNVGAQRFICKGEAYGTQAIVGETGILYTLQKAGSKADVYALKAVGSDKPYLFRTSSDSKIGEGVKGCFSDGSSMTASAYWHLAMAEEDNDLIFTLQVPETDGTYTEGEYLGVQPNHISGFTSPTYGLYWDLDIAKEGSNCYWAFIPKDSVDAVNTINALGDELLALLVMANLKSLDVEEEQAVCDNVKADEQMLLAAVRSLRHKLGLIYFADARTEKLCVNEWDADHDGYLSYDEAAAVTSLGLIFKGKAFTSFDELRYFTSITSLPDNAFLGCASMVSIYLPENLTSIGGNVFKSCSALKYIASLAPSVIQVTTSSSIPTSTLFVDEDLLEAYAADAVWCKKCTIKEYTGIPTVTAENASRVYGARTNLSLKPIVTGAPINGVPTLTCEAVLTTPAGDHPIIVAAGTITTPNLVLVNGILTIEKAPLTVTAKSYTRKMGEENPEFEVTYKTFKNKETFEVLNKLPIVTCEATPESPAGAYDIVPSGAEADNYEFTYVNGVLTIETPDGIISPKSDTEKPEIYNLAGQRITLPVRGVNIIGKKKVLIK